MSIYVGNLSYEATEEDLSAVFAEYGKVVKVHLPMDRETGRKRGFGFVDMESDSAEETAIAARREHLGLENLTRRYFRAANLEAIYLDDGLEVESILPLSWHEN
ncbi:MAG: hypothetical protein HC768_20845 [Acaryochloris sp. CRU_2_0]|nr:hypothetical protein [Acaryochloris sp. CRU_2_0]